MIIIILRILYIHGVAVDWSNSWFVGGVIVLVINHPKWILIDQDGLSILFFIFIT